METSEKSPTYTEASIRYSRTVLSQHILSWKAPFHGDVLNGLVKDDEGKRDESKKRECRLVDSLSRSPRGLIFLCSGKNHHSQKRPGVQGEIILLLK